MGCQGRTRWGPHAAYYYRGVHGKATELWALLIQMLSTFLDAYREFHTWRRHTGEAVAAGGESGHRRRGPGPAPTPSSTTLRGWAWSGPSARRLSTTGRPP